MAKTAVVTDSTAYIPEELCKELNITVVPLAVIWGDESYLDGVTMKPADFYARLQDSKVMPSTSQATPEGMKKAFSNALDQGMDVMGVFISEKLSGTLDSARQAREELASAKDKIAIFDSETGLWSYRRVAYDIPDVQSRMRKAGLPERHIMRLEIGW